MSFVRFLPLNAAKRFVCRSIERIRICLFAEKYSFIFDAYKFLVAIRLDGVPELVRFND